MISEKLPQMGKRTARFELARAEPSRFLVYPINRSGTSAAVHVKKEKEKEERNTRTSRVVPHRTTNLARCRLTSVCRRERVASA